MPPPVKAPAEKNAPPAAPPAPAPTDAEKRQTEVAAALATLAKSSQPPAKGALLDPEHYHEALRPPLEPVRLLRDVSVGFQEWNAGFVGGFSKSFVAELVDNGFAKRVDPKTLKDVD